MIDGRTCALIAAKRNAPPLPVRSNLSSPSGWSIRRWIFTAGGALIVAGLVAFAVLSPSRSLYFFDPLTGPTSPKLSIPLGKYGYTSEGLRRNQSEQGMDRPVVKTISGAYLQTSRFTAEVNITMADDDIAFVGVGQATTDPSYYNEPANCFLFRIHSIGYNRIKIAVAQLGGASRYLDDRDLGPYIRGTTETLRIVRDGDYVTLSVPSRNVSRTYSISQYNAQLGLTAENTHLFFSNTGVGTVFSNFRVTPTAATNDQSSPGQR